MGDSLKGNRGERVAHWLYMRRRENRMDYLNLGVQLWDFKDVEFMIGEFLKLTRCATCIIQAA